MDHFFARFGEQLVARITGPMKFRLVLQPAMTISSSQSRWPERCQRGKPAYFWGLFSAPAKAQGRLEVRWKGIHPLEYSTVLDAIYQFIVLRWFYPGEAVAVAIILTIIP